MKYKRVLLHILRFERAASVQYTFPAITSRFVREHLLCISNETLMIQSLGWTLDEEMNYPCNLKAKEVSIELNRCFSWSVRPWNGCYRHTTDRMSEFMPRAACISLKSESPRRWMDPVKSSDRPGWRNLKSRAINMLLLKYANEDMNACSVAYVYTYITNFSTQGSDRVHFKCLDFKLRVSMFS